MKIVLYAKKKLGLINRIFARFVNKDLILSVTALTRNTSQMFAFLNSVKIEMLPFGEIPDEKTGNDLSYLESYFKHLNSISDTYSNLNFENDDDGYDDRIARINCKYYSAEDFVNM